MGTGVRDKPTCGHIPEGGGGGDGGGGEYVVYVWGILEFSIHLYCMLVSLQIYLRYISRM